VRHKKESEKIFYYVNHYAAPQIHDENLSHYYRAAFLKLLAENSGLQKGMGEKSDEKKAIFHENLVKMAFLRFARNRFLASNYPQ
jgi:hypothetical protein